MGKGKVTRSAETTHQFLPRIRLMRARLSDACRVGMHERSEQQLRWTTGRSLREQGNGE